MKSALNAPVVLRVESGAVSCEATHGPAKGTARTHQEIFIYKNAAITVRTAADPLFGIRVNKDGSLKVQVKKGMVLVGALTKKSPRVSVKTGRQRLVKPDGSAGANTPLTSDPALESAFLAVHPNLCEKRIISPNGGNPGSHPQGLAADKKGNLWFTDDGTTPAIGMFDRTNGRITETSKGLNPGTKPRWITSDTNGNIWFTDDGSTPAIGKINPTTRAITEYGVTANGGNKDSVPWAIANDRVHNLLWFTDQGAIPAIGMIDPKSGAITEYSKGLNPGSHPEGITVDTKGNVWFTDDNDPKPAIGMLNGTTHEITEYSTGLNGSLPRGIETGPDGNIWFADQRKNPPHDPKGANDGLIGKINPATKAITEYAVAANGGNVGSRPEGLAADTKGNIWFTEGNPLKPAIGLIKPLTGAIIEQPLKSGSAPMGIVVTLKGLWFADQFPIPMIGTISPSSSRC